MVTRDARNNAQASSLPLDSRDNLRMLAQVIVDEAGYGPRKHDLVQWRFVCNVPLVWLLGMPLPWQTRVWAAVVGNGVSSRPKAP